MKYKHNNTIFLFTISVYGNGIVIVIVIAIDELSKTMNILVKILCINHFDAIIFQNPSEHDT